MLVKAYRKISDPPVPNLKGERDVEYSWIAANMPAGPGEALDFGAGEGYMGLLAARRGFAVTALDLEPVHWSYGHPNLRFSRGDIFEADLPPAHFDLIINCSSIEHVGLSGRYGVKENRADGDIEAMAKLRKLLKPGGRMLLTIPVGRDAVFSPFHRVYGEERLPSLMAGYAVEREEYWAKDHRNKWILAERSAALSQRASRDLYGLGCFVLLPQATEEAGR